MTTIEKMAEALGLLLDSLPENDEWWCPYCGTTDCTFDGRCDKCGTPIEEIQPDITTVDAMRKALTAYEAEKTLLAKTQDWHDHGAVAPSCIGCPTAEAKIAEGEYTRVITEKLEDCIINAMELINPATCRNNTITDEDIAFVVAYLKGDDDE